MGGVAAPMAAPTTAAPTRSFSDGAGAGAGVRAHAGSFDGAGAGLAQSGSGLDAGGGGRRRRRRRGLPRPLGLVGHGLWGGLPLYGGNAARTKRACPRYHDDENEGLARIRSRGRRSQPRAFLKCLLVSYRTLANQRPTL